MRNLVAISVVICLISVLYFGKISNTSLRNEFDDNSSVTNENVEDILFKTKQKYDSIVSYKCKGIIEFSERDEKKHFTKFEINYEFPSKMNVSWKKSDEENEKSLVIKEGEISSYTNEKLTKKFDDINSALFDMSFDNDTSRFQIAKLLILREGAKNKSYFANLRNLQRLDDEEIEGKIYYKIKGDIFGIATEGKAVLTYWIEKESHIIRRIDRSLALEKDETSNSKTTEKYYEIDFR